ncbi:MAG TPA: alkaline phosphatase, partial [Blastocatellia bacterium]|nr:alkaline phosphatase [Blastocatellia bacterium]
SIEGSSRALTLASLDATGGFTIRGCASTVAGTHTITAIATETGDTTPASVTNTFEIVDVAGPRRKYRNIIVCLGDGMSIAHRTAARIVRYGYTAGKANGRLAMDDFPVSGMVMTSSLNSIVTDSSPGMSCYSTGNKSNNNQEGVYPDNTPGAFDNPRVEYIGELLHRKLGKVVGIVTTADLEDATPAAFAVHTSNRGAGTGICDQYLDESELPDGRGNGVTVLLGGGARWFLPAGTPGSNRSAATDYQLDALSASELGIPPGVVDPERDLLGDFRAKGFSYAASKTELDAVAADPKTRKMLGLFTTGNMNVAFDKIAHRRNPAAAGVVDDVEAPDQPMLDEMTRAALAVLDRNRKGFVLLVEGASIDKQTHSMDADRAIWETIEFDNAIRVCREFAERDGNTLVIVVSDHECAGFSVIGALRKTTAEMQALPSDAQNLAPVSPDNAAPARQSAVGRYDEAGFPKYAIAPDGYPMVADPDYKLVIGFGANGDRFETWLEADPNERASGFFIRGQVPGEQAAHTASDVPISAFGGKAAMQFTGVQDNTDVFFKLLRAAFGGY